VTSNPQTFDARCQAFTAAALLGLNSGAMEKAFNPDQSRDDHGRWGEGSGSEKPTAARVNEILAKYDGDSKEFTVFRVQRAGAEGLEGKNAGDMTGVTKFLLSGSAEESAHGDSVGVYKVTNPSGEFGAYQYARAGTGAGEGIGRKDDPIKWGSDRNSAQWYSFGKGDWSATKVAEVPLSRLNQDTEFRFITSLHSSLGSLGKAYNPDEPRNAKGEWGEGGFEFKPSEKMKRAMESAVRTGQKEQAIADRSEAVLSEALGIPRTANNSAFDLRNDDTGIEVKTLVSTAHEGNNVKITMSKAALGRKLAEQRAEGLKGYTVVVDRRAGGMTGRATYYVKEGFGSFRLTSMTKVSLSQLREIVKP
jgi:hypothetical protein